MRDSMNHTRLPKEVQLPDSARRDMQGTKGDRVSYHCKILIFSMGGVQHFSRMVMAFYRT
jgi:hypothetical protein